MIILLSPAKSLDYETPPLTHEATQPRMVNHTNELVEALKNLGSDEIGKLMHISPKLAKLNYDRYQNYQTKPDEGHSRQAILAFTGDVYQGMDLASWSPSDFDTAQSQIRILSGLYGVLRPLDRIQPHRLEMGTRLKNARGNNLYDFWGTRITEQLNKDIKTSQGSLVLNLASNEYFSSVKQPELKGAVVTPIFKDEKNGVFKVISFYAKKARGRMADFIIRNQIRSVEDLKSFDADGYTFNEKASDESTLMFQRKGSNGA